MKNCPVCHSDYNADECPECGWPDTATKHGLNDLISWADDGGRFIWLDEAIGELSTLREKAAKVDVLEVAVSEAQVAMIEVSIGAVGLDGGNFVVMYRWIRDKCRDWLATYAPEALSAAELNREKKRQRDDGEG